MSRSLDERVTALEQKVETLMKERPGRRPRPILVSETGVCGLDPSRDSSSCPDASLWYKSKGCRGTACSQKSSEYYAEYRRKNGNQDDE